MILATISPACAFVWASTAFSGRISDLEIVEVSWFMLLVKPSDCYTANHGFGGLAHALLERGATVPAPPRKNRGVG
jgi:predicted membrane protein